MSVLEYLETPLLVIGVRQDLHARSASSMERSSHNQGFQKPGDGLPVLLVYGEIEDVVQMKGKQVERRDELPKESAQVRVKTDIGLFVRDGISVRGRRAEAWIPDQVG